MAATTVGRESMTDGVTVWNVTRIGSSIYDRIDTLIGSAINFGGTVGSEGFGTHTFSASGTGGNVFAVRNPTAGTTNQAAIHVGQNESASALVIQALSSTFTGSTSLAQINSGISGGLRLTCSHAGGEFSIFTNSTRRITISPAGVVTPASGTTIEAGFFAYNSASDAGVANNTDIDFDTEVYDEGGNFAADTFTAPTTGRYLLSAHVRLTNSTGGAIAMQPVFLVSNHANGINLGYDSSVANGDTVGFSGSVIVDMDAADTATVRYFGGGNCTVEGNATQRYTWFCGRRLL